MSFKNKKKGKLKNFNLFDKRDKLEEAAFLIEGERFEIAIEFLEETIKKYPNEVRFWEMLAYASSETKDVLAMQKAFGKLTEMQKDNADVWIALATSYALDSRIALAYQTYQEVITRFPEDETINDVYELFDATEQELHQMFADFNFPVTDKFLEIAAQHEKVQILMNQTKFDEAIKTARDLLDKKPDFFPTRNNLSLTLYMNGEVEAAAEAARKVLETHPDNFHALANLVRFLVFLGKQDEAKEFGKRLRKIKSDNPDIFVKKIEAFSFLCDDEAVVETFKESNELKNEFTIPPSFSKHLAAFAFYRLGDEKKAEKLWEEIIEEDIDFDYSEWNLEELDLPEYQRDVFGLTLQDWIPNAYRNKLLKATSKIKDGKNFDKNLQKTVRKFFDEHPYFLNVIPILFDRSDYAAKEFAIRLLEWAEIPEGLKLLEDFAFSKAGSDEIRHTAAMTLSRLDAVPNKVEMWHGGELREMGLMIYEITDEPLHTYPLKPKAEDFLRKGVEAMFDENLELAEQYFQMGLDVNGDHPSLLYNLLTVGIKRGKTENVEKQLKNIIKKFPDYTFAPLALANRYVREGKVKEAKKLTEKFHEKKQWHHAEIKLWFYFNLEYALAEKHFESARKSMEMLAEFDENFDSNYWEERIMNLELLEKLAPLVKKADKKKRKKKAK